MPVVFISHGAPDALLKAPDAVACWRDIGQQLPEPSAILVISAHWEARQPTASLSGAPETLHDFSGFSPELHRMQYPAPGAPALAERTVALLGSAGIPAELHPSRGLDHGAWVPLSAMYPQATVPVTQLSLIRNGSPAQHFALGQALAPLRDEGVLIVATGAITHNFDWLDWRASADQIPVPQARSLPTGSQRDWPRPMHLRCWAIVLRRTVLSRIPARIIFYRCSWQQARHAMTYRNAISPGLAMAAWRWMRMCGATRQRQPRLGQAWRRNTIYRLELFT